MILCPFYSHSTDDSMPILLAFYWWFYSHSTHILLMILCLFYSLSTDDSTPILLPFYLMIQLPNFTTLCTGMHESTPILRIILLPSLCTAGTCGSILLTSRIGVQTVERRITSRMRVVLISVLNLRMRGARFSPARFSSRTRIPLLYKELCTNGGSGTTWLPFKGWQWVVV